MILFYTNIYFYTLIILIIIYIILKKHNKFPYFSTFEYKKRKHLLELDKYYVENIYFTMFANVFYFISTLSPFIYIRYQYLGTIKEIQILTSTQINFHALGAVFIVLLNIMFYLNIIHIIFYPYAIQLHFYLCQFSWYEKLLDSQRDHGYHIWFFVFFKMELFLSCINDSKKELKTKFKYRLKTCKIISQSYYLKQKQQLKLEYLLAFYIRYFNLQNIITILCKLCNNLLLLSDIIRYIPHTAVIISLFFDVFQGYLFYTYYALLFYLLANIFSKVRYFLHVKDCVYDNAIRFYFYNNSIPYTEIRKCLNDPRIIISDLFSSVTVIGKEGEHVANLMEEIIGYEKVDFKVYYIVDKERDYSVRYTYTTAKRFHMLLLLALLNIYIIISNKYIIILNIYVSVNIYTISVICFTLTCWQNHKIKYVEYNATEVKKKSAKKRLFIFFVIIVLQLIVLSYIILINKIVPT